MAPAGSRILCAIGWLNTIISIMVNDLMQLFTTSIMIYIINTCIFIHILQIFNLVSKFESHVECEHSNSNVKDTK